MQNLKMWETGHAHRASDQRLSGRNKLVSRSDNGVTDRHRSGTVCKGADRLSTAHLEQAVGAGNVTIGMGTSARQSQ